MKPTADIVEELRLYNRWRRGDEAITAPDPTALGKLLDDAADRIEHLFASGIHTCHDDCQRPMCVLRRERDKALADLARVESATPDHIRDAAKMVPPAKHPDTALLDSYEEAKVDLLYIVMDDQYGEPTRHYWVLEGCDVSKYRHDVRSAIIDGLAAMKEAEPS